MLLTEEFFFHHFLHSLSPPSIPPLFLTLAFLLLLTIPILSPHWLPQILLEETRGIGGEYFTSPQLKALSHVQPFE